MEIYERTSLWNRINFLDEKLACYADDLVLAETREEKIQAYNNVIKLVEEKKELFKKYGLNYYSFLGSKNRKY